MHDAPVIKKVLEYIIYPIETIKIRIGQVLEITLKSWLSPNKPKQNRITNVFFYDHSVVQTILKAYRKIFGSIKKKSYGLWLSQNIFPTYKNIISLKYPVIRLDSTYRISSRIAGYWIYQKAGYPVSGYPAKSLSGVSLLITWQLGKPVEYTIHNEGKKSLHNQEYTYMSTVQDIESRIIV